MPAGLLKRPYDHLLFHVFKVAERHGPAATGCGRRFATQLGGNFGTRDLPVLRGHRELCHQVPKFADIARPGMRLQDRERVSSKHFVRRFQGQEVPSQRGNIFGTLAQRRNAQLELAQAVKKIFAEAPFVHRQFKILIGSGNYSHINCDFSVPAQTVIWRAVQHAQQFHLDLRLQFANFVQKNRALVRQFEQTGLRAIGAAEGSLFVAEQFTFHQMFGQGGAVDIHQRMFVPIGGFVYGSRH